MNSLKVNNCTRSLCKWSKSSRKGHVTHVWGALLLSCMDLSTCHGLRIQPLPAQSSQTSCYGAAGSAGRREGGLAGLSWGTGAASWRSHEGSANTVGTCSTSRLPDLFTPGIVGCNQGGTGPQGSCAQIRKRCPHVVGVAPTVHGW